MTRLFQDASIRTKLIFTHLLLIILPTILIIILFYSSLYDLIVNDSIRQEFAVSRQSAEALEAQLAPVTAVASAIQSNTFIRQLCTDSISDDEKSELLQNNAPQTLDFSLKCCRTCSAVSQPFSSPDFRPLLSSLISLI